MAELDISTQEGFVKAIEALKRISDNEVGDFLASRGAKPNCPFCNSMKWGVVNPSREGVTPLALNLPDQIGNLIVGGRSLLVVQIICQQCAFVRSHAAAAIGAWKYDKDQASGKSNDLGDLFGSKT
ncbi:hypothetical protein [Rhizobacter sp. OV335]|uniref:hypothetical protein n=1 Tax=Rhizobacter sp. OV335 TaxID=1500264 RepID=UPI0009134E28|nr:hypothetical protein [Rhizobacter sp. OV335]SHN18827.1 hypothetical protein SAMN02787076_03925 [Rhizobacter sp. OV335]